MERTTLIFALIITSSAQALAGQSLKDAYVAAVKRSETLSIQKESVYQAKENTTQAYGALMPTITGSANWTQSNLPVAANANSQTQRTSKVTLDQPLFRGLKDFAGLRQRKYLVEAQAYSFKTAAKQLFLDLATAYYNVQALQNDKINYELEIKANEKRLAELRHFLKIGRSRETDLLTLQSNISALEAQLEQTKGNLESAKDVLAFITGWDRETQLSDSEHLGAADSVQDYLARIEDRPDVRAASASAKASSEGVPIARAGHMPSLDLLGNYYFERPGVTPGQADWDVQLALTIPIFAGGIVQSQVRQAQSISYQSELQLSSARRSAEQEIRTYFDAYNADRRQVKKLEETVAWAKKSYEAQTRDYKNGLVTNLDVLQALTAYQDAQRALDHQKSQMQMDGSKLQAAAAQRPEIDVRLEDEGAK